MKSVSFLKSYCWLLILSQLFLSACQKDPAFVPDNEPPHPDNVPTVLIENYVNRMFIDLIGREPLDAEMDSTVEFLKANDLKVEAREIIIERLQSDTSLVEGDTSFKYAYYQRFYDISKSRIIEGESDAEIYEAIDLLERTFLVDSLNGDTIPAGNFITSAEAELEIEKLENVLFIKRQYRGDSIEVDEIYRRLCNNSVYDEINMNTFNFIRATFDNLYYRFPTDAEFASAWEMCEKNQSANLLGVNGQTKGDFLHIVTTSREFYEGMIIWAYLNLLARFPTSAETSALMNDFYTDHDFQNVQKKIMVTNEYANF
ncbi:MAG: hypothetical protein SH857_08135 [Chitinophagales bacterium]|nr:hypothetical protein [Chitinophagales bacterium]